MRKGKDEVRPLFVVRVLSLIQCFGTSCGEQEGHPAGKYHAECPQRFFSETRR